MLCARDLLNSLNAKTLLDLYRLIVVADKQTVYDEFPIPLINRLEKHFLTSKTMLTEDQLKTSRRLQKWTETMTSEALHLRY